MKELLYGKYIVRETKAPEGFLLDKGEYSVFIEKDETTYSVENKAGVGFFNEAMRGILKIVKTSSDGKVKGFAFRVTGANGYDMTFETDKNGEIVIEGLRIGEYTVSEVANNPMNEHLIVKEEPAEERNEKESEPLVPAWEQKKKVKGFDLHPDVPMADRHTFNLRLSH